MSPTHRRNSALLMPAMKGHRFDDTSGAGPGRRGIGDAAGGRRLPMAVRVTVVAILCGSLLFLGGFAVFATHVGRMSTPPDLRAADAIIVLTGGQARLDAAVSLLKSGKGQRLLISGVHPTTSRKSLQAATGGEAALFACCVDIDHAALDTIGNAEESAKWMRGHDYGRVILVTNNYHMPRSLLEMGRLLDREEVEPYPVVNSDLRNGGWMVRPEAIRVLLTEYGKYLFALARGLVPLPRRSDDGVTMVDVSAGSHD